MHTTDFNFALGHQGKVPLLSECSGESGGVKTTAADVANSVHLPTLPDVASQLLQLAQQEDPDFNEMAKVIRFDPAISGKLLTTANSALFGFRSKIESVEDAIPKLGSSLVRTLILGFYLSSFRPKDELVAKILPKLWRSFLAQAVIAESVAEQTHVDEAKCFLAGMIQDIGILALITEYPQEYTENVLDRCNFPNVIAAEKSYFGFSHIDVTLEIIKKWNIGDDFLDALRHHHDRLTEKPADGRSPNPMHAVLQAAHIGAGCLLGEGAKGTPDTCQLENWHAFLQDHFGYEAADSTEILKEVGKRVEESSVVFGVETGNRIDSARIANVATSLLQTIAINSHVALTTKRLDNDSMYRDFLSGLRNRRFLGEVLSTEIAQWIRKRKSFAMLFIDVDGFKKVNDTHGHKVGDRLIKHIASWLESATRPGDYVLRLGGDEFLVAAPLKHSHLASVCNRLVEDAPPMKIPDGGSIDVALSAGCIFYEPAKKDKVDPNWIIDQADQLMYNTKRGGGKSVTVVCIDGKNRKS